MSGEEGEIIRILDHLLTATGQLRQCEEYPDMDVDALTAACREGVSELEKLLSANADDAGSVLGPTGGKEFSPHVREMLKSLETLTYQSIQALERCRDRIGAELSSLRHTGNAIRSYRNSV